MARNVKTTSLSLEAQTRAEKNTARLRILPITLSLMALMAASKVVDVYLGVSAIQSALAEEQSAHGEEEEKPRNQKESAVPEPITEGTGKTKIKDIKKVKERQNKTRFSAVEVDILQDLKKRREELEAREKEIELKLKVVEVAEKRLNERIGEMRELQRELKLTLGRYEAKQDEEIRGLVKIYENMKPGFAANIFNELDMPILLSVVDKMSERKVAPILAAMKPERAKEVTEELAELRKLRSLQSQRANTLTGN